MKQLVLLSIAILVGVISNNCQAQSPTKTENTNVGASNIEVYYFHFTRRCITCNAVEAETQKSLKTLYPQQLQKGTITFVSVNLDEESSKSIAKKSKVTGQGLLVMSGSKRTDLTSKGFMYARNNPEKLTEELRKTIDPLLKSNK